MLRIDLKTKEGRDLIKRLGLPVPTKERKYRNEPQVVDGIKFDSVKEAKRYSVLKIKERIGEISDLSFHPSFDIIINGLKVCSYKADFQYFVDGCSVVEDVKSDPTAQKQVYRLKKKLMKAVMGIDVVEIRDPDV